MKARRERRRNQPAAQRRRAGSPASGGAPWWSEERQAWGIVRFSVFQSTLRVRHATVTDHFIGERDAAHADPEFAEVVIKPESQR